jgi:putative ABC transport system permease protein
MIFHYLRTAYRIIVKHKTFSLVNVLGLTVGITAALIIGLYAQHELSYDRFHQQADEIYLVYKERVTPNGVQPTYDTWVPLLERLQQDFPEVGSGTRFNTNREVVVVNDQRFEEEVAYVDPSFFGVFSFPIARGNTQNPLPNPNSVLISSAAAHRFFGDQNPIGQTLTLDYETSYIVSGVLATIPTNSSLQFDLAVPIQSVPNYSELADEWGSSFLSTFVVLADNEAVANLETQFPDFVASVFGEEVQARTNFKLLPLSQYYDAFIGNSQDVYILLCIALGIILIAAINFMNLSTARAVERMKEVGMRKVLGASRAQLVRQFLSEAIVMSLIALGLGVLLVEVSLPWINQVFDLKLTFHIGDARVLSGLIGFGLLLGLLSGGYPSLFLSRLRIEASLKGRSSGSRQRLSLRNGLVVAQFTLSVLLIAGTMIVWKQLTFMKEADMAFEPENVVVLPVGLRSFEGTTADSVRLQTFKESLSQHSHIQQVSSSAHIPSRWDGWFTFVQPKGWEGDPLRMRVTFADAHYFSTFDINFQQGRPFYEGSEVDRNESVILNQAALQAFGWENAQDKFLILGNREFSVVGVVDDYHFESLRNKVAPILHFYRPPENGVHQYISWRTGGEDLRTTLDFVAAQWNELAPDRPLEYQFLNQNVAQMYEAEDRLLTMVSVFSVIAVLIACMGLFALSLNNILKRKKEIGIRKVLGASVPQLVTMITRDFTRLIIFSFLLATPLVYVLLPRWLEDFAYRTEVGVGILLMAGGAALVVAWLTVGSQSIKAALANPVDSLRSE